MDVSFTAEALSKISETECNGIKEWLENNPTYPTNHGDITFNRALVVGGYHESTNKRGERLNHVTIRLTNDALVAAGDGYTGRWLGLNDMDVEPVSINEYKSEKQKKKNKKQRDSKKNKKHGGGGGDNAGGNAGSGNAAGGEGKKGSEGNQGQGGGESTGQGKSASEGQQGVGGIAVATRGHATPHAGDARSGSGPSHLAGSSAAAHRLKQPVAHAQPPRKALEKPTRPSVQIPCSESAKAVALNSRSQSSGTILKKPQLGSPIAAALKSRSQSSGNTLRSESPSSNTLRNGTPSEIARLPVRGRLVQDKVGSVPHPKGRLVPGIRDGQALAQTTVLMARSGVGNRSSTTNSAFHRHVLILAESKPMAATKASHTKVTLWGLQRSLGILRV